MNVAPNLPIVTGAQMAAVDTAIVQVCGLELMQVMETAGRAVAVVARQLQPRGPIAVLCGSGGNGGDGFVCARYLAGWGFAVDCWLSKPAMEMSGLAAHQMNVCRNLEIPVHNPDAAIDFGSDALIVDGLFGFGLAAAPVNRAANLIEASNRSGIPVISIDLPSGVDATSGAAYRPAISASLTVTLGLPKVGLLTGDGPIHAGQVVVADIGIPAAASAAAGIPRTPIFDSAEFVTLDGLPWPA